LNVLSVIIVNYRAVEDIQKCLSSAFQFQSSYSFEWLIVNNDSEDNSCKEIITTKFPSVKWIDMGYNAGFSRANNRGISQSQGEAVLLLNPDTIIIDDAIAKCFQRLMQSDYVASAVQLLNEDSTPQITGNFFMKGGLNHLLPLPYLGAFLRSIAFAAKIKKTNVPSASKEEVVDWINGAFLMVKKSAIEKAGLLDEDFFLYSEEIEWCSRLREIGELCVYGDLFTIHLQGETIEKAINIKGKGYTNLSDKKGLQLMVSHHVRIRKQFGKSWFLLHLFMHTIEIPIFFVGSFFAQIVHFKNPFIHWKQAKDYSKNVFRLWKLMPSIFHNKAHFYKMF
jgi:GT2 family glycosyltransferase